jgi:hypothetical protein
VIRFQFQTNCINFSIDSAFTIQVAVSPKLRVEFPKIGIPGLLFTANMILEFSQKFPRIFSEFSYFHIAHSMLIPSIYTYITYKYQSRELLGYGCWLWLMSQLWLASWLTFLHSYIEACTTFSVWFGINIQFCVMHILYLCILCICILPTFHDHMVCWICCALQDCSYLQYNPFENS